MKPLLLDLFCGAGGASVGYSRAGFEVVGVDINPQPNYPFEFIRADALDFAFRNARFFDVIHASPPCQWQTAYRRRPNHVAASENLIEPTRQAIRLRPHIIESPSSSLARAELRTPITLCGSMFGLDVRRHRLFESNMGLLVHRCNHARQTPRFTPASNRTNLRSTVEIGVWRIPLGVQQKAMGIDWMTREELSQAIPPAYTERIGQMIIGRCRKAVA